MDAQKKTTTTPSSAAQPLDSNLLGGSLLAKADFSDHGAPVMLVFGTVACLAFFAVGTIGLVEGDDFLMVMLRAGAALGAILGFGWVAHNIYQMAVNAEQKRKLADKIAQRTAADQTTASHPTSAGHAPPLTEQRPAA